LVAAFLIDKFNLAGVKTQLTTGYLGFFQRLAT
jgi:hypothetical protein